MELDFAADVAIDPAELDEDWMKQAGLYMKYASIKAEAIKKRDQVWERLKVRRSELVRDIMSDPKGLGPGGKATGDSIEAYYRAHPDHKALKDELIEAEFELNIADGAVMAFSHKRTSLENMVRLLLGEYWAGPKEPRDIPGGPRVVNMEAKAAGATSQRQRESLNKASEPDQRPSRKRR